MQKLPICNIHLNMNMQQYTYTHSLTVTLTHDDRHTHTLHSELTANSSLPMRTATLGRQSRQHTHTAYVYIKHTTTHMLTCVYINIYTSTSLQNSPTHTTQTPLQPIYIHIDHCSMPLYHLQNSLRPSPLAVTIYIKSPA